LKRAWIQFEIAKREKTNELWMIEAQNEKSINYIVKYVTKIDPTHPGFMGKIFTSKGIGAGYEKRIDAKRNEFRGDKTDEQYKTPS
jgi:hypothetical protein